MKIAGKWMQLERSIPREGTQALKDKQRYILIHNWILVFQ